jgi:hypothetical protein
MLVALRIKYEAEILKRSRRVAISTPFTPAARICVVHDPSTIISAPPMDCNETRACAKLTPSAENAWSTVWATERSSRNQENQRRSLSLGPINVPPAQSFACALPQHLQIAVSPNMFSCGQATQQPKLQECSRNHRCTRAPKSDVGYTVKLILKRGTCDCPHPSQRNL